MSFIQPILAVIQDRSCEHNSSEVAEKTLTLIKSIINQSEWSSAKDLMSLLKREGKTLVGLEFIFSIFTLAPLKKPK